jgi:predicted transcriptional regulator
MHHSTLVHTIDPGRVKELMAERGLDVATLARQAGITPRTLYTILCGRPVSLGTAGRVFRALGGDRDGFFAVAA